MSGVQIPPGAPLLVLGPREDQFERLPVRRIDTYRVHSAVRKHHAEQFGFLSHGLANIQKMRLVREFENPDGINHSVRISVRQSLNRERDLLFH